MYDDSSGHDRFLDDLPEVGRSLVTVGTRRLHVNLGVGTVELPVAGHTRQVERRDRLRSLGSREAVQVS